MSRSSKGWEFQGGADSTPSGSVVHRKQAQSVSAELNSDKIRITMTLPRSMR
jgi:hypothetical protein